jgi:hypothetical protein
MHGPTHTALSNQDGSGGLEAPFRPVTGRDHATARAATEAFWPWLAHVTPVGGCMSAVRARVRSRLCLWLVW